MKLCCGRSLVVAGTVAAAGAVVALAWWQPWHTEPTPPPGDPDFPIVEMPPIPVHPDSEKPYRPYDYQLTTDQTVRMFEDRVRADPNVPNLSLLGGLYIRKAKESGDHA